MNALDLSRPHIVTAPHQIPFAGGWVAFCTCGDEFVGNTADEVREAGRPHRDAERERLGGGIDRDRDEERRRRREARREQRNRRPKEYPRRTG